MPANQRKISEMATSSSGRIFAVGDIHGCSYELELLLAKIQPKKEDTVVFLGDYVDRGPDTRGVVDLILKLQSSCNVVALKGNHEQMFLDFLERPESAGAGVFILNGGSATLANYALADGSIEIPEEHMRFFKTLKLRYETDKYFFVHAGIPDQPLSTITDTEHEMTMLWARYPFLNSTYKWEKLVVHGHTPVPDYDSRENRINVDTGCVYDGKLTAIELPKKVFHQVARVKDANRKVSYPTESNSARISTRFSGRIPVMAGKPGDARTRYETLNYNQFGLLMKDLGGKSAFEVGDAIEGRIGDDPSKAIDFAGTVVRAETRGPSAVFGIKIDKISGGVHGGGWIERPSDS